MQIEGAASVGYIAIKGNSHSRLNKFRNISRESSWQAQINPIILFQCTIILPYLCCNVFETFEIMDILSFSPKSIKHYML